jgi:hypothetical protein
MLTAPDSFTLAAIVAAGGIGRVDGATPLFPAIRSMCFLGRSLSLILR